MVSTYTLLEGRDHDWSIPIRLCPAWGGHIHFTATDRDPAGSTMATNQFLLALLSALLLIQATAIPTAPSSRLLCPGKRQGSSCPQPSLCPWLLFINSNSLAESPAHLFTFLWSKSPLRQPSSWTQVPLSQAFVFLRLRMANCGHYNYFWSHY